jgi:hypothetical protein
MSSPATLVELRAAGEPNDDARWPVRFRPVLRRLVQNAPRYFGAEDVKIEPVRELDRPFSTLLQIRVLGGPHVQGAFVKVLKPRWTSAEQIESTKQNVIREFDITSRVHAALLEHKELAAVRPVACLPELCALVTAQTLGANLASVLTRSACGWASDGATQRQSVAVRRAAAWLRAAQHELGGDHGTVDFDVVRTYLERRFIDLERTGPVRLTARGRVALERYCERLIAAARRTDDLRRVWIHADYCPDNIIAGAAELTVLDFTMAKTGTLYHDVSHLFMRIDAMRMKPWLSASAIDRVQTELLEGFEPGLRPERPLFALMLLQHVVCHQLALQAVLGSVSQLTARWMHRRHRQWLADVANVGPEGWTW